MADAWTHDALAADLADHLRGMFKPAMIWLDMQLGPAGSMRPDVFSIERTYTGLITRAFEVKISRSDFLADATAGKAQGYRSVAGALAFAAPKGLLKREEIPDGCGLIERGESGWRWVRKPVVSRIESLPTKVWLKLLMDGIERVHDPRAVLRRQRVSEYTQQRRAEQMLGAELGKLLADRERARIDLQFEASRLRDEAAALQASREERAAKSRAALEDTLQGLRAELSSIGEAFGFPNCSAIDAWRLREAMRKARPQADAASLKDAVRDIGQLADQIGGVHHAIQQLQNRIFARVGELTTESTAAASQAAEEPA